MINGEQDKGDSIHDDIRAAMSEAADAAPVVEEAAQVTESLSNRDENGRFKPKNTSPDAVAAVSEQVTETPAQDEHKWSPERPPSSWKPATRELWGNLPLEVRQEITRREEDALRGATRLQEQFAPLREIQQHMEPIIRELQGLGVSPQQHIDNVMATERRLRTADLPTKFDALLGIADQYGIPLREIVNRSVGQEVLRNPQQQQVQIPQELQREIQQIKQWQEQQEQSYVNNEVAQFGGQQEFFNDVRLHMADLIEKGVASDLNQAYEMATWANPEIRGILIERQARGTTNQQVQTRQARAASASIKPSGSVHVEIDDGAEDSIADTVRKAWSSSQGRV